MTTGADDVWIWWALGGWLVTMDALVFAMVARRRGHQRAQRTWHIIGALGAAFTAFALVRLLA